MKTLERGESFFPQVTKTFAIYLIKEVAEMYAFKDEQYGEIEEVVKTNVEMWYSVEAQDPIEALTQFVHEMHEAFSGELFQGVSYKIIEFKGVYQVEHKFAGHKVVVDDTGKHKRPFYKVYYHQVL